MEENKLKEPYTVQQVLFGGGGGLILMFFVVDKHPRKLNQQNCHVLYELSIKKTVVPSAHDIATVLP